VVAVGSLRWVALAAAAVVLASCSSSSPPAFKRSKEFFSEAEFGRASPRVVQVGQRGPKGGGRMITGDAYRVAGKTYIPRDTPRSSETGLASWYGDAFHGRLTANGEVYDVEGLTAAHPTMPLPSYARVTNLANGRSMIVRVNDRGPFARDRVIDVSSRVADMLDFKSAGTARVRVDYMGPAQMDGLDERMLVASYREGGKGLFGLGSGDGAFAIAEAPAPRVRPAVTAFQAPLPVNSPMLLLPLGAYDEDPLGPLIIRTSMVNGYAAEAPRSAAQSAADDLARAPASAVSLQAALDRAAARRARELGLDPMAGAVVQLASFADADNAARVMRDFRRFGEPQSHETQAGGRTLVVVTLRIRAAVDPADVVAAAADAGLRGAFVLDR
jgi:rare lipoprotein A